MINTIAVQLSGRNALRALRGIVVITMTGIPVAGCATQWTAGVQDQTVKVETTSSRATVFKGVTVEQSGENMEIRGKLSHRWPSRAPIRGHIDLSVIAADGAVLWEASIEYRRRSVKSRTALFHTMLELDPPPGSTVYVRHHEASMHDSVNRC